MRARFDASSRTSKNGLAGAQFPGRREAHAAAREAEHDPVRPGQREQDDQQGGHGDGEPGNAGRVDPGRRLAGPPGPLGRARPWGSGGGWRASATRATGTFTKNTARQPSASTRTPPTGRPSEAVAMPAICRPPRTPPGRRAHPGLLSPPADEQHRGRVRARGAQADQRPADQQRQQVLGGRADHAADQDQEDPGQEHPARPEDLGHLARGGLGDGTGQIQRRDQRRICPIDTCTPAAIGTRAVAIRELLTGFRAEPMNSGVVNRHEKGVVPVSPSVPAGGG